MPLIGLLMPPVYASEEAALEAFASERQWRRLLHFRDDHQQSDVLAPEFFVSSAGNADPAAELRANLAAFSKIGPDEEGAQCRFPARFVWLQQRGYRFATSLAPCRGLNDWVKPASLRSVSLLMVSGYFGNPASTFGHSLLKINNHPRETELGLLDLGVNFGAMVPPGELVPVYIAKGLFGGYRAGFSDKSFYSQDQVYARTEQRDMWEYELALTPEETQLFVLHVWEIAAKPFQYFFLKENCAYRLAELVEMATDTDLTGGPRGWYPPVELFHAMQDSEARTGRRLIGEPRFVPSNQRRLFREFASLSEAEQSGFRSLAEHDTETLEAALADEQSDAVLQTLLAYYNYREVAQSKDPENVQAVSKDLRHRRRLVLSRRLSLPIAAEPAPTAPAEVLASPVAGERYGRYQLGLESQREDGSAVSLGWTPFHYDAIGHNSLRGSALAIMDTQLLLDRDGDVYLDRLHVVRASKNTLANLDIPGESRLAWDIGFGWRTPPAACFDCGSAYAAASLGQVSSVLNGQRHVVGAKAEFAYEAREDQWLLTPGLHYWLIGDAVNGLSLNAAWRLPLGRGTDGYAQAQLAYRHSFTHHVGLRLHADWADSEQSATRAGLTLEWRP